MNRNKNGQTRELAMQLRHSELSVCASLLFSEITCISMHHHEMYLVVIPAIMVLGNTAAARYSTMPAKPAFTSTDFVNS